MAETAEVEITTYLGLRGDAALQKMWADWEREKAATADVIKRLHRECDAVQKANAAADEVLRMLQRKVEEIQNPKQVGVFERVHVWLFGTDVDG